MNATAVKTSLPERILSVLGKSLLPMSAFDLAGLCAVGMRRPDRRVRNAMAYLESSGLVVKYPANPVAGRRGKVLARWTLKNNRRED